MYYTYLSTDVDECASRSTHNCSHNCNNTVGAFFCSCDYGYRLDTDGVSCYGALQCVEMSRAIAI